MKPIFASMMIYNTTIYTILFHSMEYSVQKQSKREIFT